MQELELNVFAFGKHPASSEYLYLGRETFFVKSVIDWVQKGYESFLLSRLDVQSDKAHHFCFLNAAEDSFISGSIKLNRDNRKREYPFVVGVEVKPYSSFANREEILEFVKSFNQEILEIFTQTFTLEELKKSLNQLSHYQVKDFKKSQRVVAMFMEEDFSKADIFYRPLEISDFKMMMR